ncbi:MAG: PEP-utilizing enzyme [Patescibacteria group bacterium]
MDNHYFHTELVKVGKWPLLPLDCDTWFSQEVSDNFKKIFGIPKGFLWINTLEDGYLHDYVPLSYFRLLYSTIDAIKKKNYKGLEKKIRVVYGLKKMAKKSLPKVNPRNLSEISNEGLIKAYTKNRSIVHELTVFDQFGFLGEEYWTPHMESILIKKLGLAKDSVEYHRVIFALTKPEEISTTLEEKRAVLGEALKIKKGKTSVESASEKLSQNFGWMPVFTFGTAWDSAWYKKELTDVLKKEQDVLEQEFAELKNYSKSRNAEIKKIVKQYNLSKEDLQVFVDFGLALDGRNEAEYIVSLAGFYLMPVYTEIGGRLQIPVNDLRKFYETDVVNCLLGKAVPVEVLVSKGNIVAVGTDESVERRINFSPAEARALFEHMEKNAKNAQGNNEFKGVCASTGTAVGIARIVHSPSENNKVQEGDILITHATTVDYLPAMKKAAAIVTEVGGLTCHAAVVSREFKIPCVVALKNATTNFKDGDMIEVLADRGMVTVVKRANI